MLRPGSLRAPIAAVALATALAAAGCTGGSSADGGASTTGAPTTTTTTLPPAAEVRVVDPGAEPRRVLQVQLAEGDAAELAITTDVRVDQLSAGRRQRVDSPPIRQVVRYEVTEVDAEGATATMEVTDVEIATKGTRLGDEAVAALRQAVAPLVGTTGTARLLLDGRIADVEFEPPEAAQAGDGDDGGSSDAGDQRADALDALAEGVEASATPLPSEAVGAGAVWEVTAQRATAGTQTEATTRFTLVEDRGESIAYTAAITVTAEPQELDLRRLPEGTTARLTSSKLTGTAEGTQGLATLATEVATRLTGTQELVVDGPDGEVAITQEVELASSIRPAEG